MASILQGYVSIAPCVQGGDCFGAFMQWGLPKGTLKDVWAAVAGDQGYLSQQQFVQCLYLMDNAKWVSLTTFPAAGLLVASFACGIPHNDQSVNQSISKYVLSWDSPGQSTDNEWELNMHQALNVQRWSTIQHQESAVVMM
jgi:hypothetical protein